MNDIITTAFTPTLEQPFTPTLEQVHILNLLRDTTSNLLINALAGSGKTSTLELIQAVAKPPVLCLAFNRHVAKELERRVLSTTKVCTINSLGHRIWAKTCTNRLVIEHDSSGRAVKIPNLLRQAISELSKPTQEEAHEIFWDVISAISLAKALGYIPEGKFPQAKHLLGAETFFASLDETPSALLCDLVDEVLLASIKAAYAGSIDYNDQVYMPALFGGTYPRFPLVLIDEAQDLSPVNHEMLWHLRASRIVAVGDPWQSIYGFRGAVQGGMQKLKARFEMTEADLSVSFRCQEAIVRNAQWRVPHMKWIKHGGRVARIGNPTFVGLLDDSAIICRNNAPLFRLALNLLAAGRSVSVSGSDIGPKIMGIMKHLGDTSTPREALLQSISQWLAEKLAKQSQTAQDIADCMCVFAQFGKTLGQAIAYAEHLFAQKGSLRLLTGHKAKGLEWDTVYHLDPWLIGRSEQELNLLYVIQTRAKREYYEIESKEIR